MSSASSYTQKLRALTDARNTKVQYPGNIVDTYRPFLALTCDTGTLNSAPSVVTLAGIPGVAGVSGNGGYANLAILNTPEGVCTDPAGNIYIADSGNGCVRKIDTAGIIRTLPIPVTFSRWGEPVVVSNAFAPIGLFFYGGILYVTDPWYLGDRERGRIFRVNPDTGAIVSVIESSSLNDVSQPVRLWIASSGIAYIANQRGDETTTSRPGNIRFWSTQSQTFIDDGVLLSDNGTNFYLPESVAVGPDQTVYIVESSIPLVTSHGHCVIQYKDGAYSVLAGTRGTPGFSGDGGPASNATLNAPRSVYVDASGNVYVCDTGNGRIRMITPDGIIQTVVGGGSTYNEGGHPLAISTTPTNMWFDAQGRMLFTDPASGTLRRIESTYAPSWWAPIKYTRPCGCG